MLKGDNGKLGSAVLPEMTALRNCQPRRVPSRFLQPREPEVDISVVLNRCHRFPKFVYGKSYFLVDRLDVEVRPRKGAKPVCSGCNKPGPIYDTMRSPRGFEFIPLWGYVVFLWYAMRRVDCRQCGVTVERVPWADGKNPTCNAYPAALIARCERLGGILSYYYRHAA